MEKEETYTAHCGGDVKESSMFNFHVGNSTSSHDIRVSMDFKRIDLTFLALTFLIATTNNHHQHDNDSANLTIC